MRLPLIHICLATLFSVPVSAQVPPSIEWQVNYGGSDYDWPQVLRRTTDDGIVVAGWTDSNDGDVTSVHGNTDYWVVKLNSSGQLEWQVALGGSHDDVLASMTLGSDDGAALAGHTLSNDDDVTDLHGASDYWILKLDPSGGIDWQRTLGGTGQDLCTSIDHTQDGGYIVCGNSTSSDGDVTVNHGGQDVWVAKLNEAGELEWQRSYGGNGDDNGGSIRQTQDGGYIFTSSGSSSNGDMPTDGFWVTKLDPSGNIQWNLTPGESYWMSVEGISESPSGGYFIISTTGSAAVPGYQGNMDYWVIHIDQTGSILWQRALGGSWTDDGQCVFATNDGGCLVTGDTYSTDGDVIDNDGGVDQWVVKLDSTGNIVWQRSFGGSLAEGGNCIIQTEEGKYLLCGISNSNDGDLTDNNGLFDFWIAQLGINVASGLSLSEQRTECVTQRNMLDISGRRVSQQFATKGSLDSDRTFSLPPGIYILEELTSSGALKTRRVYVP